MAKMDKLRENAPENYGYGNRVLHSTDSTGRLVVDFLSAWKWPIVGFLGLLVAIFYAGWVGVPDVPPEAWGLAFYAAVGAIPGAPLAYLLVKWLDSPEGVEILDLDGISDDHRHLRIGSEAWDELEVRSPWGSEVTTAELKPCTINGLQGYEVMDLRVTPDGTLTCVSTWLGEDSSTTMRAYKSALYYARQRLQRRAQRASMQRANVGALAREAAERVIYQQIRAGEASGVPNGEEIEDVVTDVMDEFGVDDPLKDDELDRDGEEIAAAEQDGKTVEDADGVAVLQNGGNPDG